MKRASINSSENRTRDGRGQGMIELVGGLVVCIPVLLSAIDLGYIALGSSINDAVCRDAARAAAAGPPASDVSTSSRKLSSGQPGYDRAVSVIKTHQPTNLPCKVSEVPVVVESIDDVPPPEQGGAVAGSVAVQTSVLITPPFLIGAYVGGQISLTSRHAVAFTYVVPQKPTAS